MDEGDGAEELGAAIGPLIPAITETAAAAEECRTNVTGLGTAATDTGREVFKLSSGISTSLRASFNGLLADGLRLSDALRDLGSTMVQETFQAATNPVADEIGGFLTGGIERFVTGLLPFERGAPFSQGRVMPFARGGVVSAPVSFPMRGGVGMMGEAGPEAILPLARGADGRLGVQAGGAGRPVSVVMNVTTPDAESFRRSQSQIAAQMSRALGRGQRNR